MEEFYQNLWHKKLPKLEALRQAQLAVLHHPELVTKRNAKLRDLLLKRGVPEAALAQRSLKLVSQPLPQGAKVADAPRQSPPAWWAAFVLSGDWR
jgi:CHAT domain-containing protein